jgi:hypothetical protein
VGERSSEYSLHHTLWNPKSPVASFETSFTVLPRESLSPGHTDWAVIQCGPPFATCGWRNIAGTTQEASLYVVLMARWFSGTGFSIDIDERKRAEDHLRDTRIKLTRVSQIATVAELSASIAHELNQPLISCTC